MRAPVFLAMVVLTVTCGPSPDAKLPGYVNNNGGSNPPFCCGTNAGGTPDTGGVVSTGGTTASPTGGTTTIGSGGKTGAGGVTSAGGSKSTGGVSGSGGGTVSSGGVSGAGGTTSTDAGRPSIDGGGNCVSKIISNGYACGTASACSDCKDNNTSLETKCKAVLDCIGSKYPCTGNCSTECFNSAGASGPVQTCVSALQTACSAGGC